MTSATKPKIASENLILKKVVAPCMSEGKGQEMMPPVKSSMTKMELAQTHQSRCSIFRSLSPISGSGASAGRRLGWLWCVFMKGAGYATDARFHTKMSEWAGQGYSP